MSNSPTSSISSSTKIKKIIVTGGSGFLGRHLCRALVKAGYELKNIDLKPFPDQDVEFKTVIGDVRDTDFVNREVRDADLVFHLASLIEAGESVKDPQKFVDFNIKGMLNVLESMRENGIKKLAFSSSAAVYGEPTRVPIKEDDRTMPINPYGMTKLAMEALLSSYVAAHGFSGLALRYFNLYGTEEHHLPETHVIPRFIKQIYEGQEMTVWGDGQHQRDYIYISDVVDAHLQAIELLEQEPEQYHYMNLSTEKPASVMDIVHGVEEAMNKIYESDHEKYAKCHKSAKIKHFPPRLGDPLLLYADASKAREALGWKAKVGLEEGLEKMVRYFVDFWMEDKAS